MNSKKIALVTGGAGFIGSHLCEALYKTSNYEVYSLDNYFTGSENNHVKGVTYINGNSSELINLFFQRKIPTEYSESKSNTNT